ncbi:thioredoxin-related transmembrane protein 2-B [Hydra vulgaris]|uniref:Thioredoxin-related transmembrane protein 2-B n=1 Tax=Hydra vulgaris TaxID=6087 RepID=A0ABM4BLR0_HYDVU
MSYQEYLNGHYILNFVASFMFVLTRSFEPLCWILYDANDDGQCTYDWRDTEILMFTGIVLMMKNRRWKPLSNKEYISNFFIFAKTTNILLFMRHDVRYGILYILFCLVLFIGFPEPSYKGPDKIKFFRGQALDEELYHNPEKIMLVEFYAAWSPPCTRFSGTFANLSLKYSNDFFEFGKLDVTRYEKIAEKYSVNHSVTSKALPTLILFVNGKESMRRPQINAKGTAIPYIFNEENIIRDFELNEIYNKTKLKLAKVETKKSS